MGASDLCVSDWRVLCWRLPLQFRLLVLGRGVATCDIFRWDGVGRSMIFKRWVSILLMGSEIRLSTWDV